MRPLVPLFPLFTKKEAQTLAEATICNNQIWSAGRCRSFYLPEFIRVQGSNIEPETAPCIDSDLCLKKPTIRYF